MVLANTWLFLNSSVSEGLPLALGEAALTGAPVVCTDVGASLRVLTDPDDGKRYSEVVAPNDAYGLARAQINLLAMLDEWAQYAEDTPDKPAPVLPHKPTPKDVEIITRRMYEKTEQRRKLGMMARTIVQKSFGGERYLREHEQMLWIGKSCYEMLGVERRTPPPKHPGRILSFRRKAAQKQHTDTTSSNIVDPQMEKMQHPRPPLARHFSAATSFSSVYMDESSGPSNGIYHEDWEPATPASSIFYSKSDASTKDGNSSTPIPRPPRTYARTQTSGSSVGSSAIATGKRPVQYGYGYGHAGGFKHVPATVPKTDARRSALMRQSMMGGSARSSVHGKSHLNMVELAEDVHEGYGNVVEVQAGARI